MCLNARLATMSDGRCAIDLCPMCQRGLVEDPLSLLPRSEEVEVTVSSWCEDRRVKRTATFTVERGSEAHIRVAACGTLFGISRGAKWGWGVMRAR